MTARPTSARGRFITFEGGEGTGKSTQARRLAARLQAHGLDVVVTREPGGSAFAEHVRAVILDPETPPHPPLAEALLFSAARADHLDATIRPALQSGRWVICDRFADSTRAYQGAAGGVLPEDLAALERLVVGRTRPELTLILDVPVEVGFSRVASRAVMAATVADRFEGREAGFHERLRQGFVEIARAEPQRCVVIDAVPAPDQVEAAVWRAVTDQFPELV